MCLHNIVFEDMLSVGTLRGGREEIWMPFLAPLDARLLMGAVLKLVQAYFEEEEDSADPVLQYATVIVSRHGVTEDQELHSDGAPHHAHPAHTTTLCVHPPSVKPSIAVRTVPQ